MTRKLNVARKMVESEPTPEHPETVYIEERDEQNEQNEQDEGAPDGVQRTIMEHELRPAHIVQLSKLLMLMEHHDEVKAMLNAQLEQILSIGYGADLKNEQWNINIERGVLQHIIEQ